MKKKLLAAIAAGAMLCGMLTAPVSAAETYQKGDVNMDGVVDIADAQLVLQEYCEIVVVQKNEGVLTEQQRGLATVFPRKYWKSFKFETENDAMMMSAQTILFYYVEGLINSEVKSKDVEVWADAFYSNEMGFKGSES